MRYTVRYETEGFTTKRQYENKEEALDSYNGTLIALGAHLLNIELIEEEK